MVGFLPSFEAAEYECQWYFAVYTLLSQPPCLRQVCLGKCLTTSSLKTNQNQTTLQRVPSPSAASDGPAGAVWPLHCLLTSQWNGDLRVCFPLLGFWRKLKFESVYDFGRAFPKRWSWLNVSLSCSQLLSILNSGMTTKTVLCLGIFIVVAGSHYFVLKHQGGVKIQVVVNDFWGSPFIYCHSYLTASSPASQRGLSACCGCSEIFYWSVVDASRYQRRTNFSLKHDILSIF